MARNHRPSIIEQVFAESDRLKSLNTEELDRKIVFLDSRAAIFDTEFDNALAESARRIRAQRS